MFCVIELSVSKFCFADPAAARLPYSAFQNAGLPSINRLKASETPAAVAAVSRQLQVAYLAAMPCVPTVTGQQCLAAVSPAVTTSATAGQLAGGRATSI